MIVKAHSLGSRPTACQTASACSLVSSAAEAWAILASATLILGKKAVPLFRPFADAYKAKWAFLVLTIGLGLAIVSAGVGFGYYTYFT